MQLKYINDITQQSFTVKWRDKNPRLYSAWHAYSGEDIGACQVAAVCGALVSAYQAWVNHLTQLPSGILTFLK